MLVGFTIQLKTVGGTYLEIHKWGTGSFYKYIQDDAHRFFFGVVSD